jgi:class 3 adenylate cyclase
MPLYIDIHNLPPGTTAEDLAKLHACDVETQGKYGVEYHKYWFNEAAGKAFCLCHAPSAEAAIKVHRESHGAVAENIIEINPPELAEGFLGGVETNQFGAAVVSAGGSEIGDPGIRTILFTDIVESTAITQSLGDDAAMRLLQIHDTVVRNALKDLGGREIKHTGDGIMASFLSAVAAVRCASRVQSELCNPQARHEYPVKVRIGLAAGEPVEHHRDLFGSTVQLAARLCARAEPDQIVVSNVVAELCVGKALPFQDLGELSLKGFDQPIRAHAVTWSAEAIRA